MSYYYTPHTTPHHTTPHSTPTQIADELTRLRAENDKLERVKELMEKRQEYLDKIKLFQQKLAWVVFDNTREVAVKLNDKKKTLRAELKAAQQGLQPIQDQISQIHHTIKLSVNRSQEFQRQLLKSRKEYDIGVRKAELCQDEVDSANVALTEIDSMQRRAEGQVEERREKVEQYEALLGDYPPEDELKETRRVASQQMSDTKKQMGQAKREAEMKQM